MEVQVSAQELDIKGTGSCNNLYEFSTGHEEKVLQSLQERRFHRPDLYTRNVLYYELGCEVFGLYLQILKI